MSQRLTFLYWCIATVFSAPFFAAGGEGAATSRSDSLSGAVTAPSPKVVEATTAGLMKDSAVRDGRERDLAVHAMLAALEHDAAMKALSLEETAARPESSPRTASEGIAGGIKEVPERIMRHPVVALAVAVAALALTAILLIAAGVRSKRDSRRFMTTTRLSLMNSEVQRACLHIEKNYTDPELSPQKVCAAIITGEPFLETLFEKELGVSVSAYISQVRIHRAKLIVRARPQIDRSEIAALVGFSDTDAFLSQFALVTGGDFAAFCREKNGATQ